MTRAPIDYARHGLRATNPHIALQHDLALLAGGIEFIKLAGLDQLLDAIDANQVTRIDDDRQMIAAVRALACAAQHLRGVAAHWAPMLAEAEAARGFECVCDDEPVDCPLHDLPTVFSTLGLR